MNLKLIFLVVNLLQSTAGTINSANCPTWMLPLTANSSKECICGKEVNHAVKCNNTTGEVYVLDCYLITYDTKLQEAILGKSIFGCGRFEQDNSDPVYHKLPSKAGEIDSVFCTPLNRTGRLCGSCTMNHYPLVYSYKLDCVPCTQAESKRNWIKYISIAFIPLTFFYAFVVLFKFHALFPSIHACILFCQLSSSPAIVRTLYKEPLGVRVSIAMDTLNIFYGIWNLDFFRALYPDICLRITPIQALFLDYTIAFYPLLLIIVTYKLMTWYSNGNHIVQLFWSPFRWALLRVKKTWDIKSSMVNVFTTFLFLSYNRIIGITFDLLIYVHPLNSSGKHVQRVLFYDASLNYFGSEHMVYGITAVIVYFIFVFLPFLLTLLYPLKVFQECLNRCRLSHVALHSFVDSIAGYYKDGTEPGTRDCRLFAAAFFFLPTLLYISYAVTLNVYYYVVGGAVIAIFCLTFTMCQPYKEAYKQYRKVTTVIFILMMLMHSIILGADYAQLKMYQAYNNTLYFVIAIGALPPLYLTALSIRYIFRQMKYSVLYSKYQQIQARTNSSTLNNESLSLITAFEARSQHLHNCDATNTV